MQSLFHPIIRSAALIALIPLLVSCTEAGGTPEEGTNTSSSSSAAIEQNTSEDEEAFLSSSSESEEEYIIIARVNGEAVKQEEYNAYMSQMQQMAMTQGQNPQDEVVQEQIRQQVIDQLVATVLLQQQAGKENIDITDAEVEEEYQRVVSEIGGEEELIRQIQEAGISKDELKIDMENQLRLDAYITQQLNRADITFSDDEIREAYDEISAQQEDLPPFEDIKDQLLFQMEQEEEQIILDELIEKLRQEADIEILL